MVSGMPVRFAQVSMFLTSLEKHTLGGAGDCIGTDGMEAVTVKKLRGTAVIKRRMIPRR